MPQPRIESPDDEAIRPGGIELEFNVSRIRFFVADRQKVAGAAINSA